MHPLQSLSKAAGGMRAETKLLRSTAGAAWGLK